MNTSQDKHRGGRGKRSENKYERFTVSLPPHVGQRLDALARAEGVSRSEMLARLITRLDGVETVHTSSGETDKSGLSTPAPVPAVPPPVALASRQEQTDRDAALAEIVRRLAPGHRGMTPAAFNKLVTNTARAEYGENRIPRALSQKIGKLRRAVS